MSDNNQSPEVKYCVHCGANIDKNQVYCPECGKLVFKVKSEKISPKDTSTENYSQIKTKEAISRKCPGCGSIISSPVLEQCPICNTKLEKLTKSQQVTVSPSPQKSTGYVFTDKKLIPERKLLLSKDVWNLREGIGVFGNSLMTYIVISIIIVFLTGFETLGEINIGLILLSQIPQMVFAVYPLWYIYSKKHSLKKLGFYSGKKMLIIAIVLALITTIILFEINYLSNLFIDFIYNSGITFGINDLPGYLAAENQTIRDAGLLWIIILFVFLSIVTFSTEIIFRGVLHNTLRSHFENNFTGRSTIIILVALVYAGLYLVFGLPLSIFFFLLYFLKSILLGVVYELSNNIYTTILSGIFYNILLITLIGFF
ncbi:MAG: type II CAAX prenyl endopeptidase Rce1 family protein [Promethearchaeota archaeon]